nr:hypothetical protein [Deltaproteobacteria bacterium]
MGAFRRRTQFAAPFILTLAAGCGSKSGGDPAPKKRFPGTIWAVRMQLPGCKADIDMGDFKCPPKVTCTMANPPAPQDIECPPGASGNTTQYVAMLADKTCVL